MPLHYLGRHVYLFAILIQPIRISLFDLLVIYTPQGYSNKWWLILCSGVTLHI